MSLCAGSSRQSPVRSVSAAGVALDCAGAALGEAGALCWAGAPFCAGAASCAWAPAANAPSAPNAPIANATAQPRAWIVRITPPRPSRSFTFRYAWTDPKRGSRRKGRMSACKECEGTVRFSGGMVGRRDASLRSGGAPFHSLEPREAVRGRQISEVDRAEEEAGGGREGCGAGRGKGQSDSDPWSARRQEGQVIAHVSTWIDHSVATKL